MKTYWEHDLVMHRECHQEYLRALENWEWDGHEELMKIIEREIDKVGDRDLSEAFEAWDIEPHSPLWSCQEFRAQYERKKGRIQEQRYREAEDEAQEIETKNLSWEDIEVKAFKLRSEYTDEEKHIDINKLMIVLMDREGLKMGKNKAYKLKTSLEMHFPEVFEK